MKNKSKKIRNKGITLIALVVTIIIMLILAGVVIYSVITDGGLFDRAESATLTYDVERAKEEIELVKANVLIDNKGKINKDDFFDGLIEEGIVGSKDDIVDNGDGKYDVTTKDDYVFEIEIKEDGNVEIEYVGEKDKTGPRIRGFNVLSKDSNSIEVEVKVDGGEGAEYTYLYKKANEEEYIEAEKGKDILTYKYEGLSQKETYNIKVIIENSKGKDEREISVLTGEIDKGAIEVVGEAVWENGQAKIEVNTEEEGYKIEYQVNGTEGEWIEVGEDGIIGNLNDGDEVYLRLNDGVNQSDYASVSIEDDKEPEISIGSITSTSNSITVTVVANDNETGLKEEGTYIYYINGEKKEEKGENSYTFSGLEDGQNYTVKVEVVDKAGNKNNIEQSIETEGVPSGLEQGAVTFTEPVWSNGTASIQVNTSTGYKLEYQINRVDGEWIEIANGGTIENIAHNTNVYVRLTDGENAGEYASTSIKDTTKPIVSIKAGTITSNSIQVIVTAEDKETGLNNSYEYFKDGSSQGVNENTTYIYSNLFDGRKYTLKVKVTDKAGNSNETQVEATTLEIPGGDAGVEQGVITFTNPVWSEGTASINVSTSTGYQIEYQKNSNTGSWTKIDSGGTISGLNHNDTIYARLTDGANSGEYASTSIKDTIAPTVSVSSSNVTYNSVTLIATASDAQSGINNYKFYLGDELKSTQEESSYNYTGLAEDTTYTLKVIVTDNGGNEKEASASIKTGISNVAPQIATVAYSTKTTNSLTIKAKATDANSSDKLTYTLYTSTSQSSGFTSKATVSNQTPGTEVTLTATGLSQYTYYYYYVTVSDGKASKQSATQAKVRTYCPGNTSRCSGGTHCSGGWTCKPTLGKCWGCNGTGKISRTCPVCNGSCWVGNQSCSTCGGDGMVPITHSSCGGTGHVMQPCEHGKTSNHKVECSHGYNSSHTIDCRHGKTSSHYYCSHNNNGVQHD